MIVGTLFHAAAGTGFCEITFPETDFVVGLGPSFMSQPGACGRTVCIIYNGIMVVAKALDSNPADDRFGATTAVFEKFNNPSGGWELPGAQWR